RNSTSHRPDWNQGRRMAGRRRGAERWRRDGGCASDGSVRNPDSDAEIANPGPLERFDANRLRWNPDRGARQRRNRSRGWLVDPFEADRRPLAFVFRGYPPTFFRGYASQRFGTLAG